MLILLQVRETLHNFYIRYEDFILPFLKFLLAFVALLMINGNLGYMALLNSLAVVMVAALVCSFMPKGFTLLVCAGFVVAHLYKASLECALVAMVIFFLLFLMYLSFAPGNCLLVVITPILFAMKVPYVAPLAAGLLGTPVTGITIACGVVVYYVIAYMAANASVLAATEAESMIVRLREITEGIFSGKDMIIIAGAFLVTVIVVWMIRRLSINYAWTIAICVGTLMDVLILLVGDLIYHTDFSVVGVLIGSIASLLAALVIQWFCMTLDYSRTEKVQFEDDEYYYYVKAVPKMTMAAPAKKVKKIASKRNQHSVKHARVKNNSR